MSVRPEHFKKLRRGRKYGRGRVKRDDDDEENYEIVEDDYEYEFEDEDLLEEKKIDERSAVYPKHNSGYRI